jgi:hypothetical protein
MAQPFRLLDRGTPRGPHTHKLKKVFLPAPNEPVPFWICRTFDLFERAGGPHAAIVQVNRGAGKSKCERAYAKLRSRQPRRPTRATTTRSLFHRCPGRGVGRSRVLHAEPEQPRPLAQPHSSRMHDQSSPPRAEARGEELNRVSRFLHGGSGSRRSFGRCGSLRR